jgi:hypothetical protein
MDLVLEELEEVTITSQNTTYAHYGLCTVCAKAKSKCVRRRGNDTCDRSVTAK